MKSPNPCRSDDDISCPGLNVAANHGFLARDGITTYTELVDAQQNIYNVGYDLANLLALLGLTLTDGDLVTGKYLLTSRLFDTSNKVWEISHFTSITPHSRSLGWGVECGRYHTSLI
jgi:hypothetical protein